MPSVILQHVDALSNAHIVSTADPGVSIAYTLDARSQVPHEPGLQRHVQVRASFAAIAFTSVALIVVSANGIIATASALAPLQSLSTSPSPSPPPPPSPPPYSQHNHLHHHNHLQMLDMRDYSSMCEHYAEKGRMVSFAFADASNRFFALIESSDMERTNCICREHALGGAYDLSDSDAGSDAGDADSDSGLSTDFDEIMNGNFGIDSENEAVDALLGAGDDDDDDDDGGDDDDDDDDED